MFPYLIAGAIGYAVAKIFESDEEPKYEDGGSVIDKSEILKAISENKKININGLIFSSFFNLSTKKMEYWMQSDYKPDKWKDYPNEIEYTKAIMQRVNYFLRKGNTNSIQILH